MTGDVIKSFLVGLGFDVDDASLSKFNKALASATLKVTALYGSLKALSAAISYGISKVSDSFEQLGYELKILAPALNKALILRQELYKAYAAAGVSLVKVVQSSARLNLSLAKTKIALEALYKSVASRFFDTLAKRSDLFRQRLYQNFPKIQLIIERFVQFVFKAIDALDSLASRLWSILTRVYDFFVALDSATDGWSTIILGVVAAWKLLNLSFLATPLGLIITGLTAILALYDDFKTYQEGGDSLIDWGKYIPIIDGVANALKKVWDILKPLRDAFSESLLAMAHLFSYVGEKLWLLLGALGSAGLGALSKFAGDPNVAANLQNGPSAIPPASPVSSAVKSSQTNQDVKLQTNINVTGVPDATAVGNAVSSSSSRSNFDFLRNLKGYAQ